VRFEVAQIARATRLESRLREPNGRPGLPWTNRPFASRTVGGLSVVVSSIIVIAPFRVDQGRRSEAPLAGDLSV
jgi:hypothetical protein